MAHDLVLGIDGGGTRTVALLARSQASAEGGDSIIGRGLGGPSNQTAVGRQHALDSLDQAVEQSFASAGLPRGPVAAVCLGLAGADRPAEQAMLAEWAAAAGIAPRVRVENDGRLVIAAGTPDDWGLAVISGTGSFALARTRDGSTRRSGGWGYLIGDEGSGYWIAIAGLRAVAEAADGRGPATALTEGLFAALRVSAPQALVPVIYGPETDRGAIAALVSVVTGAAERGDPVAVRILDQAAAELARVAAAAARVCAPEPPARLPLALAGGVLLSCELLRKRLLAALGELDVCPDPLALVSEPAGGAVRLARQTLADLPT